MLEPAVRARDGKGDTEGTEERKVEEEPFGPFDRATRKPFIPPHRKLPPPGKGKILLSNLSCGAAEDFEISQVNTEPVRDVVPRENYHPFEMCCRLKGVDSCHSSW